MSTSKTSDKIDLSNTNPINDFIREAFLAIGLVLLILGSLWIATGQFPPMVVVESGSMMHDTEDGSLGAIDPGDLVLVMNPDRVEIRTFVEAMQEDNENFEQLFAWYDQGKLKPFTSKTYTLDEAALALNDLKNRKAIGKLIIQISS